MQTLVLSNGEKEYLQKLLKNEERLDGRDKFTQRNIEYELNILPLSPTSCKVRWGVGYGDTTEIIVSIINEVSLNENTKFQISVKSLNGSFGSNQSSNEICQVISNTLDQFLINSEVFSKEKLNILNSNYSWKLFIDVLIIKSSGGIYEATMNGIYQCLSNFTFPHLLVTPGESTNELHFDIDESKLPEKLLNEKDLPIVFSFSSINNILFIDPTPLEITTLQSLLVVAISRDGKLLGLTHFGEIGLKPWILNEITNKIPLILNSIKD